MRCRVLKLVGATVALSLLAGTGAASAGTAPGRSGSTVTVAADNPARATLARAVKPTSRYSDRQVLEFLVLGEGPIDVDHPRLAADLGFVEATDEVDRVAVAKLMDDYLASHPEFRGRVAAPLQSGNPQRVDAALEHFAVSFNDHVEELYQASVVSSGEVSTQGWVYTSTWAVTAGWALAVAGAVVYGAVAGFHAGVAVTVIVYVYLPGMEGAPTSLERDTMVRSVSTALGG